MNLLELKRVMKKKKPRFIMQDAHILKRLKQKWRKPQGIDSKMRLRLKGYGKSVEVGYGSPKEVKYLHKSGLKPVVVATVEDIQNINREKEGIVIATQVGMKKRVEIIKKAMEANLKLLNIRNAEQYLKSIEECIRARKDKKIGVEKKKAEKKTKKKESKEDKLAEKVLSEEEKAEAEKKEKDRLLTKKEI